MVDEKKLRIRNGTNDFLIFSKENGGDGIDVLVSEESVWLTQRSLCSLYDISKSTVSEHLKTIFKSEELDEVSVVRNFRTPASDGKIYDQKYYNLQAIVAVGFKTNSQKAIRFRAWASHILSDFAMKGYVLDKERLKHDRIFSKTYFEHLLEDIREIRLSERKFYQKITDIYATSFDYDPQSPETLLFFKMVQNKMHFAIHGHTAAEVIVERADADRRHMGLVSWETAPKGKIRISDVTVAKNYLSEKELRSLERIVMAYLEFAEFQAERHIPMTMEDWKTRLDLFLSAAGTELLDNAGRISALEAKIHAENEYEKYRVIQDEHFRSDFDLFFEKEMKKISPPERKDETTDRDPDN
ncbi:MAG: virulence RhuM family protein [Methanomassiliicoccaceae archaeon]|nr:virulence RhuM family protein [Methanomassiliicoccaceae archaeon]